jgi:hypothetical protein
MGGGEGSAAGELAGGSDQRHDGVVVSGLLGSSLAA